MQYASVQAELTRLKEYPKGWNGPRSSAAQPASFALAFAFIKLIQDIPNLTIHATICSVGTAVLEINHRKLNKEYAVLIEFVSNGELAVNVDSPEGKFDYDLVGFDGTSIPPEIQQHL